MRQVISLELFSYFIKFVYFCFAWCLLPAKAALSIALQNKHDRRNKHEENDVDENHHTYRPMKIISIITIHELINNIKYEK